jgi:beta-glucosidase
MNDERLLFPGGFLWGTATAAHQVEGDNTNNDWWHFEQQQGAIRHGDRSGLACDWWRKAECDFDLMAEMGHTTHRLSVEWSRIEPEPGVFDPSAVDRYRRMLAGLRQRGLEPMVTLFHFSLPQWLAQRGGWRNPATISYFRRFVHHTVEQLGDLVTLWCTVNEPNVYAAMGHLLGEFPPAEKSLVSYFRVLGHLLRAHGATYRLIHALDGGAQVGLVKNLQIFEPLHLADGASARLARLFDSLFNGLTLEAVAEGRLRFPLGCGLATHGFLVDTIDFLGLNYYYRQRVSLLSRNGGRLNILQPTPGAEVSDQGRNGPYGEVYPTGMYLALKRVAPFGKPIYITENGLPDEDDDQRPRFLLTHLSQVQRAIREGVDVRGYYHWSFTDNFEWAEGWSLRFGLVALDEHTQVRTPRPSARLYTDIIQQNAITRQMVAKYAPEAMAQIYQRSAPERVAGAI